ncbi:tRNA lysidine(34) synthetase [Brevundimonas bullata]|uniref:tRNA lysidine(34) synthetase n=2 Tax=Brevundimonas bullata TaxID=13160 RepID=UPI002E13AC69|nr:tRNA lysidine(34) synthetase [Brevundimonas bullata]
MAVALSGGGDSMALLHLAADWATARGRRLLALTVDHNLNAMSADWTLFAGEAARAVGAEWRGLSWDGARAGPGLTARARAARHGLIAEAARAAGARVVLLAQTLDDVAEADWMRARGSTLGRVREWSPSPVWPQGRGLMLLRPLLEERREGLRGFLRARGQGWVEDPANGDERFGRSRARAALAGDPAGSLSSVIPGPVPGIQTLDDEEPCGDGSTSRGMFLDPRDKPEGDGEEKMSGDGCDPRVWAGILEVSRDVSSSALAAALVCAGGGSTPPRGERLAGVKARLAGGEDFTAGLAGARVEAAGASVLLMREPGEMRRRAPEAVRLAPGVPAVWDGRFEITATEPGWRVEAAAGRLARLCEADRRVAAGLPPAARGGLPVLIRDGVDAPVLAWRGADVRALGARRLSLALGETTQESDLFQAMHGETPPTDLFS